MDQDLDQGVAQNWVSKMDKAANANKRYGFHGFNFGAGYQASRVTRGSKRMKLFVWISFSRSKPKILQLMDSWEPSESSVSQVVPKRIWSIHSISPFEGNREETGVGCV